MKRVFIIAVSVLGVLVFSGCIRRSYFYDYDELTEGLVRAHIVYVEDFFGTSGWADVELEYAVIRELTHVEADRLIRELTDIRFRYTVFLAPATYGFVIRGYSIKLHYEGDAFKLLGQTADYRYGRFGMSIARMGRSASDRDWDALMLQFISE
ncbi:MAG: hypothetical protein FWB74_03250 [Defluviitaleaceae bacterium]|nr:hypothetical protein [Defluviitaleaceae bacterium]